MEQFFQADLGGLLELGPAADDNFCAAVDLWGVSYVAGGYARAKSPGTGVGGICPVFFFDGALFSVCHPAVVFLVMAKSPFLPQEVAVENGIGLNPLLQDPWMAIHPPIIFLGYALWAVLFAYCAAALIENQKAKQWLEQARQWALVAWAFLGAGIFVHVLRVARVRGAVLPMVHLAAVFAFSLVCYGTFLTRSGILGDFSVHSFSGTSIGLPAPLWEKQQSHGRQDAQYFLCRRFGCFLAGWHSSVFPVILAGAAVLGAAASVLSGRKKVLGLGGMVAHFGLGISLLAIVLAGSGSKTVSQELRVDEPVTLYGHEIVFKGQQFADDMSAKYYRYTVDGRKIRALTKLHANGEDAAREPAVDKTLAGDLYIAPMPPKDSGRQELILKYGRMDMDDLYAYRYKLSADAKKTVNANCLRCHENTMKNVHAQIGVDLGWG